MKQQFSSFHNGVKIVSFCPLCSSKFNVTNAQIIEEQEDAQMIYIKCSKCHIAVLAVIMLNQIGITSFGLISDLSSDEILKFKDNQYITSDEVIEFHKLLKKQRLHKFLNI